MRNLKQEQLAVVGHITLTFNDLEAYADAYLTWFLEPGAVNSNKTGELIIGELRSVDTKLKILRKIAESIWKDHHAFQSSTDWMQRAITEADEVRKERNRIVHSVLLPGRNDGRVQLQHRGKIFTESLEELQKISQRCMAAVEDFNCACGDVYARVSGSASNSETLAPSSSMTQSPRSRS